MIIGFGSTEEKVEETLEKECKDLVIDYANNYPADYFTDEFIQDIEGWAKDKAVKSREIGNGYKNSDTYPERYSYYWISVVGDPSYIVFIVSFHHINRRHAFSPDGWAMMRSERCFYVRHLDIERKTDDRWIEERNSIIGSGV